MLQSIYKLTLFSSNTSFILVYFYNFTVKKNIENTEMIKSTKEIKYDLHYFILNYLNVKKTIQF